MLWSGIQMLMMGAAGIYTLYKAHFAATRRLALAPLCMLLFDACNIGANAAAPLSVFLLLAALRLAVLCCCAAAVRQDARRYEARRRVRVRRSMRLCPPAALSPTAQRYA